MLRILVIPHEPATKIRTRAIEIAREFVEIGHKVDILGLDLQPKGLSQLQKLDWHRRSILRGIRKEPMEHGLSRITLPYLAKGPRRIRQLFARLVARLYDSDYDIVFNASYGGFYPPAKSGFLIYDFIDDHAKGHEIGGDREATHSIRAYMKEQFEKSDAVTASSAVLVSLAREKYQKEACFAPNGANIEEIQKSALEPVSARIGYIGGLDNWVDLKSLISAMEILRADVPNAELYIVGDGVAREGIEKRDWVTFTGFVTPEEVPKYLHQFSVGVVPFEVSPYTDAALPLKVIEYGAAKKVTVSTPLLELKKQNFPWVILSSIEPKEMASHLKEALEKKWQSEWDEKVREFQWRKTAEKILQTYQNK